MPTDLAPTPSPNTNVSTAHGLKQAVLTPLETLAQSIAGIAPSATPGMLIPIVFGFAGNGTWLSYVLATVGVLFTAKCINEFASRSACPGSLYTFVSQGLGTKAGLLTGWSLLFAYIFCGACCVTEFALYALSLCQHLLALQPSSQLMMMLSAGLVAYIGYKNVKLSASLMLWLEFLSIGLILMVVGATLNQHGLNLDTKQLTLTGVSFDNVRMGLVMAIFSFVAFESAASLGTEAKDPLISVPKAIMHSVVISGIFFVIAAYAMVASFRTAALDLHTCSTPLLTMSTLVGIPQLGQLIDIGIMMSFFAAGLANLNAAARILYRMSQTSYLPAAFARIHKHNNTPHVAIITATSLSLAIALVLSAYNFPLLDIVGWLGTLGTFGFIYGYIATSIATVTMLKGINQLTPTKVVVAAVSCLVLVLALVGSIYPAPPAPYNILPYVFLAHMVVGLIWCKRLPSAEVACPVIGQHAQ